MPDLTAKVGMGIILLLFAVLAMYEVSQESYKVAIFYTVIMALMVYLFNKEYGVPNK